MSSLGSSSNVCAPLYTSAEARSEGLPQEAAAVIDESSHMAHPLNSFAVQQDPVSGGDAANETQKTVVMEEDALIGDAIGSAENAWGSDAGDNTADRGKGVFAVSDGVTSRSDGGEVHPAHPPLPAPDASREPMAEGGLLRTQDVYPKYIQDDGNRVGTEVAAPPQEEMNGATDETLADNAGAEVRSVGHRLQEEFEDLSHDAHYSASDNTAAEGADKMAIADSDAQHALQNPTMGVQAEADELIGVDRQDVEAVGSDAGQKQTDRSHAPRSGGSCLPPQSLKGEVVVTATVYPIGFRTVIRVPVHRNWGRPDGHVPSIGAASPGVGQEDDGWVLIAKDLFDAVADRLSVHPQGFHIYHQTERVRFMSTLFLGRDRTAVNSATQAEPMWITVNFSLEAEGDIPIPTHLTGLHAGEVLVRCIRARRRQPEILPCTLVEGRRSGYTFDEVIRSIQSSSSDVYDANVFTVVPVVHDPHDFRKPFLGGFRVKHDHSRVTLHASTQLFMKDLNYSPFPEKKTPAGNLCSRQTQTLGVSRSCQTRRECTVQTPRPDVILSDAWDIVVRARPYFSADELHDVRVGMAVVIQKLYRQWKARQIRRQLEEEEAEKQLRAAVRQIAEETAQAATDDRELLRRADPKTAKDFEVLRRELELWRASEMQKIQQKVELSSSEKRAALLALTKQELRMLQDMDNRRQHALFQSKDKQFEQTLRKMATPKTWGAVSVTTPETVRAAELHDLYHGLTVAPSSPDARLDILLHVKWVVREFSSPLTGEICELIDRESDLLNRGRREASLAGLRKRLDSLFKRFIEDPEYNPAVVEYTRTALGRAKAATLSTNFQSTGGQSKKDAESRYTKSIGRAAVSS